jgi:4-amino-4-deoxy-L-arabinose transferase-like glycosyltransferase
MTPEHNLVITQKQWGLICALTLVAFGLRAWGAEQSAPYVPDTQIVRQAMDLGQSLAGSGSLFDIGLMGAAKYPLVLPYLFLFVYGMIFVVGRLIGSFESLQAFTGWLFLNRVQIHVITVYVIAFISALSVPLVFLIARRFEKRIMPWVAAVLMAFSLTFIHFSHHARPHVPLAFFVLLTLYFSFRLYETGRLRDYLLAGTGAALAAGTLQNGMLAIIPVGVAHLLRADWGSPKTAIASLLSYQSFLALILLGIVLIINYPQLLTDPANVIKFGTSRSGNPGVVLGGEIGFSLKAFGLQHVYKNIQYLLGYEPLVVTLGAPGLVYFFFVRQHRSYHLIVASFAIVFGFIFVPLSFALPHYFSPLAGVLVIFAARLVAEAARLIENRLGSRSVQWVGSLGAVAVLILTVYALRLDVVLGQTDTRSQARDWIEAELSPGTEIAAEFRLELYPTRESILRQQADLPDTWGTREQWLSTIPDQDYPTPAYGFTDLDVYAPKTLPELSDLIKSHRVQYIVFEQYVAQPRLDDPAYNYALKNATRVAVFCPRVPIDQFRYYALPNVISSPWLELWAVDRPGPIVQIFVLEQPLTKQPPVPDC